MANFKNKIQFCSSQKSFPSLDDEIDGNADADVDAGVGNDLQF